ncbi:MAG: hypothetical protein K6F33_02950 [Bacteroidales bacterium]|nr:hypothetical protein [Bacteroidales bacterium]
MKRLLIIAFLAVFSTITASAQTYDYDVDELRDNWNKTISVPASDAPIVEKLFMAWSKEFPTTFAEILNTYKKTGKTDNQGLYDYKVDYAPKNGFIEVYGTWSMISDVDGNYSKGDTITRNNILQAVYWNLQNGNKLFGVSIEADGECFANCAVFFYEYNVAKNVLTPRTDITKKVLSIFGEDQETFVQLPKVGRDIKYYDYSSDSDKVIKWNGNGF